MSVLTEKFKAWRDKRLPPPPQAARWSDSDLQAAYTEGAMNAIEHLGGVEMLQARARATREGR